MSGSETKAAHENRAGRAGFYRQMRPRVCARIELLKVLIGGGVLALLVITYLLLACAGRDQSDLLGVIGMGLGYMLHGRGGGTG